jgi:putative sporulation protein YtaF
LILSALLFSLSFNMDNIVVGTAYGIKKIKIGVWANLIIAAVTTIGTYLSMSAGTYIAVFLPASSANLIGSLAIGLLGLYFIIQSAVKLFRNTKPKELALKNITDMMEYAEESDFNSNGKIDKKEAFFLGLGLMLNNLGTGITASLAHVNIPFTTVATFVLSILTLLLGEAIGNRALGKLFGKYAPMISGILLVVLGIFEYFH